jgi:hypothetical protein
MTDQTHDWAMARESANASSLFVNHHRRQAAGEPHFTDIDRDYQHIQVRSVIGPSQRGAPLAGLTNSICPDVVVNDLRLSKPTDGIDVAIMPAHGQVISDRNVGSECARQSREMTAPRVQHVFRSAGDVSQSRFQRAGYANPRKPPNR